MNRIIRVLEYEGTENWIANCLANRQIKEEWRTPGGSGIIREGIIGRSTSLVEPEVPYAGTGGLYETLMSVLQTTHWRMRHTQAGGVGGELSAGQSADTILEVIEQAGLRLVRK